MYAILSTLLMSNLIPMHNAHQCYFMDESGRPAGPMIAAFSCQSGASDNNSLRPQPASLRIYPLGLRVVDHILVSALVVERKRLTPSVMGVNAIFN